MLKGQPNLFTLTHQYVNIIRTQQFSILRKYKIASINNISAKDPTTLIFNIDKKSYNIISKSLN